jgi:hypothetical protein
MPYPFLSACMVIKYFPNKDIKNKSYLFLIGTKIAIDI